MSTITISNKTITNISLPSPFGVLLPRQSRTFTNVTVADLEKAGPGLVSMQTAGDIEFDVTTPAVTGPASEVTFAPVEALGERAALVIEEFTNPPLADDDYFLTSTTTADAPTVVTAFTETHIDIPRNVTVSRSAALGSYTTDVITLDCRLNGDPVVLTFTPADADGGDTITSNEDIGITDVRMLTLPAQVDDQGAFTVGFGDSIGLASPMKVRAGLPLLVREIVDGAFATNGVVSDQLYSPVVTPDGSTSYALVYERA